jgi:NADH-quinone oxidoreductase E subunit
VSALPGSAEGTAVTGLDSSPVEPAPLDLPPLTEQTRLEAREIMARYPVARSALLPMLHLVQSVQGYVSPEGVTFCAQELGLTKAEVGAVATFYTMYKRRPTGRHLVSVCTNTLCSVLGGQRIMDALSDDLGVHHDETTADGSITLEHAECLAACDYAPVVTVDYEFYDQQDVDSARELVAALRRGEKPLPTRGAPLTDFKGISRQLAGFSQHGDDAAARAAVDAPGALGPTLVGLRLAEERGESAPEMPRSSSSSSGASAAEAAGVESAQRGAPEPAGRSLADRNDGTDTPVGTEPGTSGQGPGKA